MQEDGADPRQSNEGDGDEEVVKSNQGVGEEEVVKSSPMYVPMTGVFFQHDNREGEDKAEGGEDTPTK